MSATAFHPRNRHQGSYDLAQLCLITPELTAFLTTNPRGGATIDFADPVAVKTLNAALLNAYYGIKHWDIPDGYLCPPVPGRADYIHYLADLLAEDNGGVVPSGSAVRVLDIGTGANIIYPLIGHGEYGWHFVGADIDPQALAAAQAVIQSNSGLGNAIELRLQTRTTQFFKGLLLPGERYQLTMCNPPFHESAIQAQAGSARKWRGLAQAGARTPAYVKGAKIRPGQNKPGPVLNFGGRHNELWCPGGEAAFVSGLIKESRQFGHQVGWFSSLVSKETSLPIIYRALQAVGVQAQRTVGMAQGHKKSRFVAWTFQSAKTGLLG